jgi:YbgC/YbaW family acyl-CoA thioester hydrolase
MELDLSRDALKAFEGTPLVSHERKVRLQDIDAAGTIFYSRVYDFFADAFGELLTGAGLDMPGLLRDKTLAIPFVHSEADYLAPLLFGDIARVEIVAAKIGSSSLTLGHRIVKLASEKRTVATVGKTVHVFVDGKTFQSRPVPPEIVSFVERAR